jgi:hypothetical protein
VYGPEPPKTTICAVPSQFVTEVVEVVVIDVLKPAQGLVFPLPIINVIVVEPLLEVE